MLLVILLAGCYEPEHFSKPGPYGEVDSVNLNNLPYPFSADRTGGVYVVKAGKPDYTRLATRGYTDFAPEIGNDQLSWYEGTDRVGRSFFGSRQHKKFYALHDEDNFGGNEFSYEANDLTLRQFLKIGRGHNWVMYARLTFESLGNNTRSVISWEANTEWGRRLMMGFDWQDAGRPVLFFYRNGLIHPVDFAYYPCYYHFAPGEPFEFELVHVDGFVYCRINGITTWVQAINFTDQSFAPVFTPWGNAIRIFDLYIEGDYEEQKVVSPQHESGYVNIQAPAVIKSGNELLLFAEGRRENALQSASLTALRSNATDIVMKRSSDNGESWSDAAPVVRGDNSVNLRPTVVTDAEGKIHLFYTVDRTGHLGGNYAIFTKTSSDGGRTWSPSREIDARTDGYFVTTQGGRGLLCADNTLILPLKCESGRLGTLLTMASADNGATWEKGALIEGNRNRFANLVEINGEVVMYIAHNGVGESRKVSTSTDGLNWTVPAGATIPAGTMGKASSGATVQTADGTLVHFTATGFYRGTDFGLGSVGATIGNDLPQRKQLYSYNGPDLCEGMTVTVSRDGGETWSEPEKASSITGYSYYRFYTGFADAVVLDDHTVLCICEGGASVPYEGLLSFKKRL